MLPSFTLVVATALLCFMKRQSRVVTAIAFASLWILMGLNTANADYALYKYLYDFKLLDASGINAGYLAAEQIAWFLGLDFMQFRMLFSAVGLGLITLFIRRYSTCPNIVLALYAFLPFMYDVVHFKFFLAASIAIYSLRFLIDKPKFYGLKYGIGLYIATLIHPASFLFIVFVVGLLDERNAFRVSLIAAAFVLIAVYSGLAQHISSFLLDSVKQGAYMTELGRFGWIPYFVSGVGGVALSYFSSSRRHCTELSRLDSAPLRFRRYFESAKYAYLPLLAMLPLSVQNFYRPIRCGNLLILIFLSSFVFDGSDFSSGFPRTEIKAIGILFSAWLVFTQIILYKGVIDIVLVTELTNNFLWS